MGSATPARMRVLAVMLACAGLLLSGAWPGTNVAAQEQGQEQLIEDLRIDPASPQSGDKISIVIQLGGASTGAKVKITIDGKTALETDYPRDSPPVQVDTPLKAGNKVMATVTPYDITGKEGLARNVWAECAKAPPSVKLGEQKLEKGSYTAKVEAHDVDGKPVTLTLQEAPPGMTLSPDGIISWKVPEGTTGRFGVRVVAKDADGAESILSYSFSLSLSGGK